MLAGFVGALRRCMRNEMYAFFVGFFCALLGIGAAYLLFPANMGIVSVFFTTLALMPFWGKVIEACSILKGAEERIIRRDGIELTELRMRSLKDKINLVEIILSHNAVFKAYVFSFMGILFVYALLQLLAPILNSPVIFTEQLSILGVSPAGASTADSFIAILGNNLTVLFICFLIALVFRSGVFIIAWNASVWGVVFGAVMLRSGILLNENSILLFLLVIAGVLPHMIMEAFSYICGAISGTMIFESISKKINEETFYLYLNDSLVVLIFGIAILVIAAYIEVFFAFPIVRSALGMPV